MKALGIILAGGNSKRMHELTNDRAIAAMPVAGSYRAIDFSLSNMANSGIHKIGVIVQYNTRSLAQHLSSSKWWDLGRKQGGLFLITPTITPQHSDWYRGTADALYQNLDFLMDSHEPYVVITSGDGIYKMDYNQIVDYHIEKNADITIVTKKLSEGDDITRFGLIGKDDDGRITSFEEKPISSDFNEISLGIYVIRRRLLIDLLKDCAQREGSDLVNDIFIKYKKAKRIYSYEFNGYWNNIATVESYYKTNMDFLNSDIRREFFKLHPDIHSKVEDYPPAKYNPGSNVKNSLVSSGTIVNGTIENSIVFQKSFIGNDSVIKNSLILPDVYIGNGVVIENCIVDSHSTIKDGSHYEGVDGAIEIIAERNNRYSL